MPAGGHVGRLGADPEWHRDLPDLVAGRVGVRREAVDAGPDPAAGGVDLQRAQPVLGVAGAFGGDPVVAERGAYRVVAKEFFEGVDGGAGVGVALGEGVPKCVGEHPVSVERRELAGRRRGRVREDSAVRRPRPAWPAAGARRKGVWVPSGLVSGRGNSTSESVGVAGNCGAWSGPAGRG